MESDAESVAVIGEHDENASRDEACISPSPKKAKLNRAISQVPRKKPTVWRSKIVNIVRPPQTPPFISPPPPPPIYTAGKLFFQKNFLSVLRSIGALCCSYLSPNQLFKS